VPPTSAKPVAAGRAGTVSLTAVPPASVTVNGRVYTTPVVDLGLPQGSYSVTFRNATWDGPVSTQLVVVGGERRRVHADFTSEPPRVVVR
jgi:hypothetical protein